MKYPAVPNFLNGSFVADDLPALDMYNPSEGRLISRVLQAGPSESGISRRRGFRS
jgi:hypothetical protein